MSVPVIFSGYISLTWSATLFTILTKGDIVFSPILLSISFSFFFFFFFNDTATTEIYTLSLHDALPIYALAAVLLHDLVFDARENLDVDDDAFHPRRHLQRRVLHVLRLLAEDRGEQLFLGRELRLAFRRDLADQDVARLHMGADPHDAPLVEVHQRLLADVRDLSRDLLTAALGVADVQLELLNVDRRIDVVLHEALGEHDRVFEIVAVPRHERHGDVGAEREIPALRARAVRDDLPRLHLLAHLHERPLVDGGVLVRPPELLQAEAVVLLEPRQRMIPAAVAVSRHVLVAGVDDDLIGRDAGDHAAAAGDHDRPGVARHLLLEPGAHQRPLREE